MEWGGWNGGGKDVGMKEWEDGWKEGRWCKSKEGRAHGVGNGRHTAVNLLGYIKQNKRKPMTVTEVSRLYSWIPTVKQPIRRLSLKCKIWTRAAFWSNCLHRGRISCVVVSRLLSLFSKLRWRNVSHQTMVTFTFQEFNRTIILMAIC